MAKEFTATCRWSPGLKAGRPRAWQGAKLRKQEARPQGNDFSPQIASRPQLYFRSRPRWATPGPTAMTKDPLPCYWPINGDHDPERAPGELMNIVLKPSPETSLRFPPARERKASRQWCGCTFPLGCSLCHSFFFPYFFLHRHVFSKF